MKNISTIIKLSSIVCAGGLLTACSSSHHSRASYDSGSAYSSTRMSTEGDSASMNINSRDANNYVSEASGSNRQFTESRTDQEIVIPLHEERVNVGKQTVGAGQVRLRKVVTTETVNKPVELRRETVVIERVDADGQVQRLGDSRGSTPDNNLGAPFEQGEITIRLSEERPVVEKETYVSGRVVARKASETDRQTVTREVRREDVQLDRSGKTENVNIRGEFREAAGAQSTGRANINADADVNSQSTTNNRTDASINATTSTTVETSVESDRPVLQTNPNAEIPDARGNARNNPAVNQSPDSNNQQ